MNKLFVYKYIYDEKTYFLCKYQSAIAGDAYYYYTTQDLNEALSQCNDDFDFWMKQYVDDDGNTTLKTRIYISKEVDEDGYIGTLYKEEIVDIKDFEYVEITFTI